MVEPQQQVGRSVASPSAASAASVPCAKSIAPAWRESHRELGRRTARQDVEQRVDERPGVVV